MDMEAQSWPDSDKTMTLRCDSSFRPRLASTFMYSSLIFYIINSSSVVIAEPFFDCAVKDGGFAIDIPKIVSCKTQNIMLPP